MGARELDRPPRRVRGIWAAGDELAGAVLAWRAGPQAAGARLRALREAAGLSQLDLAAAAGVRHQTVSKLELELGRRSPEPRTLAKLAGALGTEPAAFVALRAPAPALTAREAAAALGLHEKVVLAWVWAGRLPGAKVGGRWRIPAAAVAALAPTARRRWR